VHSAERPDPREGRKTGSREAMRFGYFFGPVLPISVEQLTVRRWPGAVGPCPWLAKGRSRRRWPPLVWRRLPERRIGRRKDEWRSDTREHTAEDAGSTRDVHAEAS